MRVATWPRGMAAAAGVVLSVVAASTAYAHTTLGTGADRPAMGMKVPCDPAKLKTAINAASSGSTLVLTRRCTYKLTMADNDNNGLPKITKTITIIGNDATITRSTTAPNFRIFEIDPPGNLTLTDLTVSNGHAPTTSSGFGDGGGIWLNGGGTLKLNCSTVTRNTADFRGGGIANLRGTVTLDESTLSRNTARQAGGMETFEGSATLNDSTVSGNTASLGGGIVAFNFSTGSLTLNESRVTGNRATNQVGGIFNFVGTATLDRTIVADNTASQGGGIFNGGTLNLNDSRVRDNTATAAGGPAGGGIYNQDTLNVKDSDVSKNHATGAGGKGGGIVNASLGTATLTDSDVTRNTANTAPGGIDNEGGTVTLIDTRVVNNQPTNCSPSPVPGCTN